ncbi:Hypothetical protein ABZS17G119_01661 [Kosakonia cowanii]
MRGFNPFIKKGRQLAAFFYGGAEWRNPDEARFQAQKNHLSVVSRHCLLL